MHHPLVEVGDDDIPDAVIPAHQLRPVQGRGEQGHRHVQDQIGGVGIKGHRRGDGPLLRRDGSHPAQKRPVAQVHSVKKAQGDDPSYVLIGIQATTPRKSF